jgi:O-antigen ligase
MERLTFNISKGRGPRQVVVRSRPGATVQESGPSSRYATVKRRVAAAVRERYDWDYLWMIAFTAVLFFRPQDHVPALGQLHLAELTAVGGLAAMAARRMASGLPIARINPEVIGVIALGAVIVFTIPFSFWPGGSLALFSDIYVKIILIFALMMSTITTPRRLSQMTWLIILICGYLSVRGIYDYMRGVNLMEGDRLRGAVGGFMENPNDLAMSLIVFMAPALIIVFQDNRLLRRVVAAGIVLVMAVAIVLTKSRAGFLGIGAMGLVVMYYVLRERPGVVFALIFAALIATPIMPTAFWDRMASITNPEEDQTGSRQQRIQLFRQGLQVFSENPLTGIGAGQFVNYDGEMMITRWRVTHNAWLQVAAELGIFGLCAFTFMVWRAFSSNFVARRLIRGPTRRNPGSQTMLTPRERQIIDMNAKGMLAGLMGWLVCAFFASVAFNWTFYYVFGLAVAGREIARERRAAPKPLDQPASAVMPGAPWLRRAFSM